MADERQRLEGERVAYLDSIRGLAALQVLLIHCFAAFAPGLVFWWAEPSAIERAIHASPLFLLYDGSPAVYVFFGLSGIALTLAYSRSRARAWTQIPTRVVRLWIPAAAACLASFVIVGLIGTPSARAAAEIGSDWLSGQLTPFPGLGFLLKEMFVNSLLLGYAGMSAASFVGFDKVMDPVAAAYVGPLWTLSIEMLGSLLILLLSVARQRSAIAWGVLLALCVLLLFRSYFICFVVGHLLAVLQFERRAAVPGWIGWGLAAAGLGMCLGAEFAQPAMAACLWPVPFAFPCTLILDQIVGACVLLGGLTLLGARSFLSSRWLVALGGISFPLYLVHWPIVIGVGSATLLAVAPLAGPGPARVAAIAVSIALSLAAAVAFRTIDRSAVNGSHRVRDMLNRRQREPTATERRETEQPG